MSSLPHHCSHCGADTRQDRAAGLTYCSGCGRDPRPEVPLAPLDADDRLDLRRWRLAFWGWFFVTPVAALLCIGLAPGFRSYQVVGISGMAIVALSALGILAVGMLGAGYCRVKLDPRPREWHETVTETLGRTAAIFVVYLFLTPFLAAVMYGLAGLVHALVKGTFAL